MATSADFEVIVGDNVTKLAATKWKKNILPDSDVTAIVFLAHGYAGKALVGKFHERALIINTK